MITVEQSSLRIMGREFELATNEYIGFMQANTVEEHLSQIISVNKDEMVGHLVLSQVLHTLPSNFTALITYSDSTLTPALFGLMW